MDMFGGIVKVNIYIYIIINCENDYIGYQKNIYIKEY